jgi:hypothetical protein
MNGRVYDPQLVKFLSPDPLVQAPAYSQSWNRYSYAFNNPMKYTDPSGYASETVEETVTTASRGCGEACQRNGYTTWYYSQAEAINSVNARWENWGGKMFNLDSMYGQLMLGMAQGISLSQSTIKPGGGSKTNTNNVLGVLASAQGSNSERTWGSYLPFTDAGDAAAQYWAGRVVNSEWWEDPAARAGLFFSVLWTDETAADTAFTLGTFGTGALLSNAGYALKFFRYPNAGGAGLNLFKGNARRFAIDFHKFEHKGVEKARLHYHRGETKSQMKKHRPYQGGW